MGSRTTYFSTFDNKTIFCNDQVTGVILVNTMLIYKPQLLPYQTYYLMMTILFYVHFHQKNKVQPLFTNAFCHGCFEVYRSMQWSVNFTGFFGNYQVVMKENQSALEGEEIAKDLMFKLGVEDKDLIKGAYIDLLSSKDA